MPRRPRQQQRHSAYYHVLNRGHNRAVVFAAEDDYGYFLQLLQRYRQRAGLRIYHYCLMSNHFHLLVDGDDARPAGGAGITEMHRPAGDEDVTAVGGEDAAEKVDKGRFAGAVLAEQRMNFARPDLEMSVLESAHAGKALGDHGHLEDRAVRIRRNGRLSRGRIGHRGALVGGGTTERKARRVRRAFRVAVTSLR